MRLSTIANQRGFTLVEITVILLVLVILGGILLPMTERYIDLARLARAHEDVTALGAAILVFLHDAGELYFLQHGNGNFNGGPIADQPDHDPFNGNRVRMLTSDGDAPALAVLAPASAISWGPLLLPCLAHAFPSYNCEVDSFQNHLAANTPGGNPAYRYRFPGEAGGGYGWRGAYLSTPILADPWGNYYAANVEFLDPKNINCGPDCWTNDVVVFSAGPNEEIDSDYQGTGLIALVDDIMYTVQGSAQ